nr:helix-turn-helix domain-containing protein [Paenibacillus baekrokdamisoli]
MHYSEHVQEGINYINDNLTSEISLKALAEHVHFSPYHFHRLFLLCTGEAPMKYLRRLRLRAASQELLSMKSNIIEIAAKYSFDSQDGFCRAFKRYYGITPGEYRKLNFKMEYSLTQKHRHLCSKKCPISLSNPKIFEEVKTIMYDINIYEKLACSHDNKKEALSTLDKVLELSERAKHSGLMSLEPEIDMLQSEIFKKSLQLLIDGIESESLREILLNYALCGGYKGKDLLIRILIIEGILAIQQGIHTLILREKLSSFFGDDFIGEIHKHFYVDSESQLKKLEAFIAKNQNKPVYSKETSLLEEPLGRMDSRSLQRLLREIDAVTLVTAISGASGKTQANLLKNVSKKMAVSIIEEIDTVGTTIISEIVNSQKQVIETLHSLRNHRDIVI